MLENIIYHTVIIVFIIVIIVYLLLLQRKIHELKTAIIPFFLEKEFKIPAQRSSFIRGVRAIEYMLSEKFCAPVHLEYDTSRNIFFSEEFKFFADILFFDKKFESYNLQIPSKKKIKQISFVQQGLNKWEMHCQ